MEIQNSYGFTDNSPEYHELMEKIYDAEFQSAESYIENLLSELNGRIDEIVLEMSRDWALVERGCLIENEIQELEVKTAELERRKNVFWILAKV